MNINTLRMADFCLLSLVLACLGCGGGEKAAQDDNDQDAPQLFAYGWAKDDGVRQADPMRWNPDVIEIVGGQWRMHYEYHTDSDPTMRIYSAVSSDGLTWTDDPGVRLTNANMPSAIVLPNGKVRLFYNSAGVIKSAVSDDGLAFEEENGTRLQKTEADEDGGVRHPDVLRLSNGQYLMFYDAEQTSDNTYRIKVATSADGLSFDNKRIVIEPSAFHAINLTYVDSLTTPGTLVDDSGTVNVYFSVRGATGDTTKVGIYLAKSANQGTTFSLQPGPIISAFRIDSVYSGPQDPAPTAMPGGGPKGVLLDGRWRTDRLFGYLQCQSQIAATCNVELVPGQPKHPAHHS